MKLDFNIFDKLGSGIQSVVAIIVLSLMASACGGEYVEPGPEELPFKLSVKLAPIESNAQESGDGYESYIDFAKGDYRVYFFSEDNRYLDELRFRRGSASASNGEYVIEGVSSGMLMYQHNIKVVMLANMGKYPEDGSLQRNVTTIDDLCRHASTIFSGKTGLLLSDSNLIPMYGILTLTNVNFVIGQSYELEEPMTLVRALAKVEVVYDGEESDLVSVELCGFNKRGRATPQGLFTRTSDFSTEGLHLNLVAGMNEYDSMDNQVPLIKVGNRWIAYMAEFDNTQNEEVYSSISLRFSSQLDQDSKPYKLYFANYKNGVADNGADNRMDIVRNTLYRFTVSFVDKTMMVEPQKWNEVFDNNYVFEDDEAQ